MRWFFSIAATLMFSTPLLAEASRETCTTALLDGPTHELRRRLRVSSGQARELRSIRYYSSQRRARLERWLERVRDGRRRMAAHPRDPRRLHRLERRERELVHQLEREPDLAAERAFTLLSPWQRRRCTMMTEPRERRTRPVIIPRARDWRGNKIYRPTPPRLRRAPRAARIVHQSPIRIAVWHPPKIRVKPLHKRPPRPSRF